MRIERTINLSPMEDKIHNDIKGNISSNPESHKFEEHDRMKNRWNEIKQKEYENKFKPKQRQIGGKVDETISNNNYYDQDQYINYNNNEPVMNPNSSQALKGVGDLRNTSNKSF